MDKIIIFVVIVLVLAIVLFAVLTLKQKTIQIDKQKYRSLWLKIENNLKKDDEQSYQMAILNADKLLGKALEEVGVPGKNMGDKMKKYTPKFSKPNGVWMAHKLRNKIAHETDIKINYDQTKIALGFFKQALKDLEVI